MVGAKRLKPGGMTAKVASALTAGVVLAHFLILQHTSNTLQATERTAARPFTTRSIALNPAPPALKPSPPTPGSTSPASLNAPTKPVAVLRPKKAAPKISTDATTTGPVAAVPIDPEEHLLVVRRTVLGPRVRLDTWELFVVLVLAVHRSNFFATCLNTSSISGSKWPGEFWVMICIAAACGRAGLYSRRLRSAS